MDKVLPLHTPRKIIHIDMDAFYASVEQRDFPSLQGKPVAVGGSQQRGVVAAASYEARTFGVRSAMSSKVALQKCPELIFRKPRFEVYREVSRQIREIFFQYTDLVEPLSLDEAYLDITHNRAGILSARQVASQIKDEIKAKTFLTASAGVSTNKFLAKLASAYQKPDGLTVVTPQQAEAFVASLPIEKFYGVGKVTAQKMHALGIFTGQELKERSESELVRHFGKAGHFYYSIARGVDQRPVEPNRVRKSLGAETTFQQDLSGQSQIREALESIAGEVWDSLQQRTAYGRTLTLKVKYNDFTQITRSRTVSYLLDSADKINILTNLLIEEVEWAKPVRLLGLTVSSLEPAPPLPGTQLSFPFQ